MTVFRLVRRPPAAERRFAGWHRRRAERRVDPDCHKRIAIHRIKRLTRRSQIAAQHLRDLGLAQQPKHDVFGTDAPVTTPTRLLARIHVRRPRVIPAGLTRDRNHHGTHFPYLACTDCRVIPSASPICCHDHP